jgi:hypothetical protein
MLGKQTQGDFSPTGYIARCQELKNIQDNQCFFKAKAKANPTLPRPSLAICGSP